MKKKENEIIFFERDETFTNEELNENNNQDKELRNYKELKEQLKFNLTSDVNNKIQRMKILYEIKQKNLYKYDNFSSFEQFIKSYVIAKSQAYMYLKIYKKVLEGAISIEKVKKMGIEATYKDIQKNNPPYEYKENIEKDDNSQNIPIRILIKDKEVYDFCKKDTKRINFFLEKIVKEKKNILSDLMIEYENYKKDKKKN
ncbi:chromosome replication/partitioning protein [Borreliella turdi]|uniref:chromosome replication/partitioning protein n=1 Tax=Borreliella turdi TaxID=57863 RepID=UPI001247240C|nr:chromosome replication/partitioning protein [Borreliella turdi]